jgi:hypothetical protein
VESVAQYGIGEALIHREREYVESSKLPAFLKWAEAAGVSDIFWTEALKESLATRHTPYARSLFSTVPRRGELADGVFCVSQTKELHPHCPKGNPENTDQGNASSEAIGVEPMEPK